MEPTASRPHMPGYGIEDAESGSGLLPWSWAVERLTTSHEYWIATVRVDGPPSVMPVWGVWSDDGLWFSSSPTSRRARNLAAEPRCTATTDDALNPVVVEGVARLVEDPASAEWYAARSNEKYAVDYPVDFYVENALFVIAASVVLGLVSEDFTGSPTRWQF